MKSDSPVIDGIAAGSATLRAPPAKLGIRRASPSDALAFAALMRDAQVYRHLLDLPHPTLHDWHAALCGHGPNDHVLCAIDAGQLAGWGSLQVHAQTRRRHAGVLGVVVGSAWWGRGIGGALIGELLMLADRWLNLQRVELSVFADNERAIRLYRAFGFEAEGVQRAWGWRDGAYVDAVLMARLKHRQAVS